MCRAATLAIALAALTAVGAHAAPAKLHPNTTAPPTRQTASAHTRHRAAPAHTRTQSQVSVTRRPTSHESGRTAGLAIRLQLAQKHAARRDVAFHAESSPATFRPQSGRAPHITRAAPAMELASASLVFQFRPEPSQEPASSAEPTQAEELESPSTHATPDAETPDAQPPDPKSEEALLRVPRGVTPASLRGSHESLERQNTRLDAEGLERIENESDLVDRIARKLLVPIPASRALTVNAELSATHRYCRPWTALFLADLSRAHDAAFHRPLEVSSAVRTMEYQKRLIEINGNAAPAEGDIVSPHMTGATIDIAKDGLSRNEISWMRTRLLTLEDAGKIDVEEEFRQACFHITVYKNYTPPLPASQAGSGSPGSTKRHKAAGPSAAAAAQGL